MAWQYLVVCVFDFIGGPILNAVISVYSKASYQAWEPMTLRGGGLYHLAMAAIVGIATWSRGMEKKILLEKDKDEDDDEEDNDGEYNHRRKRCNDEEDDERSRRLKNDRDDDEDGPRRKKPENDDIFLPTEPINKDRTTKKGEE